MVRLAGLVRLGEQSCLPDGTWGPCAETSERPEGCGSIFGIPIPMYDTECCVAAGGCCQDYDGSDPTLSKGKCDQISCPGNIVK